jgi:hypothetical protein
MKLEPQIKQAWGDAVAEIVAIGDPNERIERLTVLVAGTFTTLAQQLDLLREELVSKGIDVAT